MTEYRLIVISYERNLGKFCDNFNYIWCDNNIIVITNEFCKYVLSLMLQQFYPILVTDIRKSTQA